MKVYHGTRRAIAQQLAAQPALVDVTRGGGELGRGFYAGESVALAASWARGLAPDGQVVEIEIDPARYVALAVKPLNWPQVWNTWQQLQILGQERTYLFGYDVVYGPLATNPQAAQHKFESDLAANVLRSSGWRVL